MTLYELCAECRNWHLRSVVRGRFTVSGGALGEVSGAQAGQYIRIVGSVFNDGVYKYPVVKDLTDETFDGAVWLLGIPADFVALLDDINAWETANADAVKNATAEMLTGPYTSESFAGYTYQKKTGFGDIATSWRDPRLGFAARLNQWRKANHAV